MVAQPRPPKRTPRLSHAVSDIARSPVPIRMPPWSCGLAAQHPLGCARLLRSGHVVSATSVSPGGWPICTPRRRWRSRLPLQRHLCPESQFPFCMRNIGTMIFQLNPLNHCKELFNTDNPQGQHALQQDPKLRQRNGWCFFSPT